MQALIEAYIGLFEEDDLKVYVGEPEGQAQFLRNRARTRIEQSEPKERLEAYLEWNGIIGFTETIWAISQGEC